MNFFLTEAFAADQVSIGIDTSSWEAILKASLVVQFTLLILFVLSVACWSIILVKRRQIKRLRHSNIVFTNEFWKANSLDLIYERIAEFPFSNMARLFKSGYLELQRLAETHTSGEKRLSVIGPNLTGIDNLERTLRKVVDWETSLMERHLTLLATTGSTGPFIGLFGTVWGIMGAFQKIGQTGAAHLAVVAPGISEALIATAIGLAAAIPAVVAYNYFLSQVKKEVLALNNFASDFLNIAKRNFFKPGE